MWHYDLVCPSVVKALEVIKLCLYSGFLLIFVADSCNYIGLNCTILYEKNTWSTVICNLQKREFNASEKKLKCWTSGHFCSGKFIWFSKWYILSKFVLKHVYFFSQSKRMLCQPQMGPDNKHVCWWVIWKYTNAENSVIGW